MTQELSLLTPTVVAYLVSLFAGRWADGFGIAWILVIVHYMIFGNGYFLAPSDFFPFYMLGIFAGSVAGWFAFLVSGTVPLLQASTYGKDHFHKTSHFLKTLAFLAIVGAGHIVYELQNPHWPKYGGGFVMFGAQFLAGVAFYFMFADTSHEEGGKKPIDVQKWWTATQVRNAVLLFMIPVLVYTLAYFIFQWADCSHWHQLADPTSTGECDLFVGGLWFCWITLIWAGATVLFFIVFKMWTAALGKGFYNVVGGF